MEESNYWTRLNNHRVSRRALLGGTGTLALGGAAAMIVGCGSGGDSLGVGETPKPIGPPTTGGAIVQGRLLAALGIDPHIDLTGLDIDTLLYPYMYSWKPDAEEAIFNNLALNLEQPEATEFIFQLRPGVKNSATGGGKPNPAAGEEITSEDVKQSFIRRGTSITAPDKRFPRKIAGSSDPAALEAALLTPDPYTFKFTMAEPFVPAVRDMANPTWAIVSAKVLDEYLYLSQDAFGAGPFQLEEFRGNERIVVKRNPNYFIEGRPRLDGITYIVITEPSSLYSAFRQGQHDVNGSVLYRDDYDELKGESDFIVAATPSRFYPVVHLKMKPPFDDIRVREALDLSINRDELTAVIWKGEGEYNGPIQWSQPKWALPQEEVRAFYPYDPERAKELLADAGYEGGFTSRLKLPKVTGASFIADMAVLLKEQWSRVGINVEIDEVELGAYIGSTLLPGNFEMTFFPNLPWDEPDRPLSFYHSLGVTGSGNWTNYTNPALDKLINAQAAEFDQAKRQQIVLEAQRMILKEHGPQLTLTGGYQYSARWSYVHFPFEIGQDPPKDVNPIGCDVWTEKV
ncbi:MAG: ABC transporter substrate-binding protein [Dehalococcoidia bacterium]